MKPGDKFKLDPKWWRDNKPKVMKSSGLGKALDKFAKCEPKFNKLVAVRGGNPDEKAYTAYKDLVESLDEIDKCRLLGIKNAGKIHKDTANALKKDDALKARRKLVRTLMSKKIEADARDIVKLCAAEKAAIEQMKSQQSDLTKKVLPLAEKGDEKALKLFRKAVTNLNAKLTTGKIAPDDVKNKSQDLLGYIIKLPGDFKGHAAAMSQVRKSALVMMKETQPLIQWTRDYANYDLEN